MARIYTAQFNPFTYDELAKPLLEMTLYQLNIEDLYTESMLAVELLRLRALKEPNDPWAQSMLDYANLLEQYATDLYENGLTDNVRGNLMNARRRFASDVAPTITALAREKELMSLRDKDPNYRNVYQNMPTLQLIIDNPTIGRIGYNGTDLFNKAAKVAEGASKRNLELFTPENINAFMYQYGSKTGYSNEDIENLKGHKVFGDIFNDLRSGYANDNRLSDQQKLQLDNEIINGMKAGIIYDYKMQYGNRLDTLAYYKDLELKQRLIDKLKGEGNNGGNNLYFPSFSYLSKEDEYDKVKKGLDEIYTLDGSIDPDILSILDKMGNPIAEIKAIPLIETVRSPRGNTYVKNDKEYYNALNNFYELHNNVLSKEFTKFRDLINTGVFENLGITENSSKEEIIDKLKNNYLQNLMEINNKFKVYNAYSLNISKMPETIKHDIISSLSTDDGIKGRVWELNDRTGEAGKALDAKDLKGYNELMDIRYSTVNPRMLELHLLDSNKLSKNKPDPVKKIVIDPTIINNDFNNILNQPLDNYGTTLSGIVTEYVNEYNKTGDAELLLKLDKLLKEVILPSAYSKAISWNQIAPSTLTLEGYKGDQQ